MPRFQTLEHIPLDALADTLNLSFSDYVIPFRLTKEQLEDRIFSDSIRLDLSVGAFEEDQLIGFILHGYDIVDKSKVAYNAGTGVIPSKRGNQLTRKLYAYILPVLRKENIDCIQLEVITTNEPAIKTYIQSGFQIMRSLPCFKGSIQAANTNIRFDIRDLKSYDWPLLQSFWDITPSWQNAITAVEKLKLSNISIGLYIKNTLAGYLIYNPKSKRVQQFSVDKALRRIGVGRHLFNYIRDHHQQEINIVNVDDRSAETLKFLNAMGLNSFITQYEMELSL